MLASTTFLGLGLLAKLVVAIELQIKWNRLEGLTGVSTTGQIVPLTVGCFTLFRAIVLVLRRCFQVRKLIGLAKKSKELTKELEELRRTSGESRDLKLQDMRKKLKGLEEGYAKFPKLKWKPDFTELKQELNQGSGEGKSTVTTITSPA
jgi:hypothetical protein